MPIIIGMRPEILETIALVTHANAFLAGRLDPRKDPLAASPIYARISDVEFRRTGHGISSIGVVAQEVFFWLKRLQQEDVDSVQVTLGEAGMKQGNDSTPWGILTDGDRGLELWTPFYRIRPGAKYSVAFEASRLDRWNLRLPAEPEEALRSLAEWESVWPESKTEPAVRAASISLAPPGSDVRPAELMRTLRLMRAAQRAPEDDDRAAATWNACLRVLESLTAFRAADRSSTGSPTGSGADLLGA